MVETLVSEIRIQMPAENKTCEICFDTDLEEAEQMFSVGSCGHEFCVKCVKQHIEVRLIEGKVPRCPNYYHCNSKLTFESCAYLLTPKLRAIWKRRMEDESFPVTERVYCPNPKCSTLMSKTQLSVKEDRSQRRCFKCSEPFCIDCKVPWHKNLSCKDYKRLCPTLTEDVMLNVLANQKRWRQCSKCQHMIELSQGCIHVTCRCGFSFCYTCGAKWQECGGFHHHHHDLVTLVQLFVGCFLFIIAILITAFEQFNRIFNKQH